MLINQVIIQPRNSQNIGMPPHPRNGLSTYGNQNRWTTKGISKTTDNWLDNLHVAFVSELRCSFNSYIQLTVAELVHEASLRIATELIPTTGISSMIRPVNFIILRRP